MVEKTTPAIERSVPAAFGAILDASPIATLVCDSDLHTLYANLASIDLLGQSKARLCRHSLDHALYPGQNDASAGRDIDSFSGEHHLTKSDGSMVWANILIAPFQPNSASEAGETFWIVQIINIDSQKQALEEISYRESIWRNAIVASGHGVWDYNALADSRFYSKEWKRIRGFPVDEPVCDTLQAWEARIHPDDLESVREHVRQHNSGDITEFAFEYRERRIDGNWIWILSRGRAVAWDDVGMPTRMTGTDIDITSLKEEEFLRRNQFELEHEKHVQELSEAREVAEAAHRIAHSMSRQDPLTSLPNRRVFSEHISQLTHGASPDGNLETRLGAVPDQTPFAVMLVDLDKFKPINDIYGHTAGDHVICQIAERLEDAIKDIGIVARLGGDEFGVIIPTADEHDIEITAKTIATTLIDLIEKPILFDNIHADIGASIGIATFPAHGTSANALFRAADLAMYHVKRNGRGAWGVFNRDLDIEMRAKEKLEYDARQAVIDRDIVPYFQPVIDLATDQIAGFEILARWEHHQFGFVAPDLFIPIIAQFGLMKEFTGSILKQACIAARNWPAHLTIALNVSAEEIADLATPMRIAKILSECNFLPTRLEIEVTETALVKDIDNARQVIAALRNSGIRVLLDDFGTGYSGLSYLRDLKIDCLKIDRSFIMSMNASKESRKIVLSMLALAQSLGLNTIAEGIEDAQTHQYIADGKGTYGQGFYYSHALPAKDIEELIGQGATSKIKPLTA